MIEFTCCYLVWNHDSLKCGGWCYTFWEDTKTNLETKFAINAFKISSCQVTILKYTLIVPLIKDSSRIYCKAPLA